MTPYKRVRLRLDYHPDFKSLFGSLHAHLHELLKRTQQLLKGTSPALQLRCKTSCGRPHKLSEEQGAWITGCINRLLEAGIVKKARRGPFILNPFVIAKADGTPSLIIDYSHPRGKYSKPFLYLPAVIPMLRSKRPDWSCHRNYELFLLSDGKIRPSFSGHYLWNFTLPRSSCRG